LNEFETALCGLGYDHIAGVDEVGRGPLAGPVLACAVILPKGYCSSEIKDSKKLSIKKREKLFIEIKSVCIAYGVGLVSCQDIDKYNIRQATFMAMKIAVENLKVNTDYVLVDGRDRIPNLQIKQEAIIKGDSLSVSIAAASIIAKVTRDKMMTEYHEKYPEFNFKKNKGYGSKEHMEAIKEFGYCDIHRKSFEPVKSLVRR
jgi:ribonuclease HII